MCDMCRSWPHLPGCPNAPAPIPVENCCKCGEGIFAGDRYFGSCDGPICEECMKDMTVSELLKLFGESLSVAQGGF